MAKKTDRTTQGIDALRPYVERALREPEFRENLREALEAARGLYGDLAKKNGGVFPMKRVYDAIDGRNPLPMHGAPGEMPIWGDAYVVQAQREGMVAGMTQEVYVRNKVNLLIDYVFRIQQM